MLGVEWEGELLGVPDLEDFGDGEVGVVLVLPDAVELLAQEVLDAVVEFARLLGVAHLNL